MSVTATNLSTEEQIAEPSFISLVDTSSASPDGSETVVTLQVYSTDNSVASATYQVDLVVEYLSPPIAQKSCTLFLEITANSFVWDENEFLNDQAPRFDEKEASGKYKLIEDPQALKVEPFSVFCSESIGSSTDEEWSIVLPKIVGEEDSDRKITVTVDMGESGQIFNYDPNSRRFTMKSQIGDTKTLEVFKIEIALLDGNNRSTRYEMTIVYRCGWDELDNFVQSYVYEWDLRPPVPHIEKIDKKGLVTVKFNATMAPEAALNETLLAAQNLG